jgi:DNA-binding transcriptional LysR family regulator
METYCPSHGHDMFDPEIDLALRVGEVRDDSLVAHPLWTFRRVAVASPDAREKLSTPADLAHISCLAFDERSFASTWTFTDTRSSCTVHVEGRFGARSYPALIAAASAGLGVAVVPEFVAAAPLRAMRLRRVLPRWGSPPMTIYAFHRVGQSRIRRVATFVEYLRALRVLPAGLEAIVAIPRRRNKA